MSEYSIKSIFHRVAKVQRYLGAYTMRPTPVVREERIKNREDLERVVADLRKIADDLERHT